MAVPPWNLPIYYRGNKENEKAQQAAMAGTAGIQFRGETGGTGRAIVGDLFPGEGFQAGEALEAMARHVSPPPLHKQWQRLTIDSFPLRAIVQLWQMKKMTIAPSPWP